MKYLLLALPLFFACEGGMSLKDVEPTTTDPIIRARELNDSAIDLFTRNQSYGNEALSIFDESISLDTSYDKPHINKIAVLMQLKRFEEAQKAAEALRQLRPSDADLLVLNGMLFRLEGDSANAVEYFSAATAMYQSRISNLDSLAPVYEAERNKLALVYWVMGNVQGAEQYAPGMTGEVRPTDEFIAAEFWKGLKPE